MEASTLTERVGPGLRFAAGATAASDARPTPDQRGLPLGRLRRRLRPAHAGRLPDQGHDPAGLQRGAVTCVLALAFLVPLDRRRLRPVDRRLDVAVAAIGVYLQSTRRPAGRGAGRHRDGHVRAGRRGLRLRDRPAQGQLVHRDARRQPGPARRRAAHLGQPPARGELPGVVVEPRPQRGRRRAARRRLPARARARALVRARAHAASGATCSRPAATPRPHGSPAFATDRLVWGAADRVRRDRRDRRGHLRHARRHCSTRASGRATSSRPWPRSSSARRSSRSARTCGAR